MKKAILCLAVGLAVLWVAGPLGAAGSFEGTLDVNITTANGKVLPALYYVKEAKFRQDMTVGRQYTITLLQAASKAVTILMPNQKLYNVMSLPDQKKAKKSLDMKITKTGNTQEILGKTCEEWTCDSKYGQSSIYGTKRMGKFMNMNNGEDAWSFIQKENLFPLKVVTKLKNNRATTWEVTKITEKSLDDSLFAVPEGYKKMTGIEDMGKSIQAPSGDDAMKALKNKLPF